MNSEGKFHVSCFWKMKLKNFFFIFFLSNWKTKTEIMTKDSSFSYFNFLQKRMNLRSMYNFVCYLFLFLFLLFLFSFTIFMLFLKMNIKWNNSFMWDALYCTTNCSITREKWSLHAGTLGIFKKEEKKLNKITKYMYNTVTQQNRDLRTWEMRKAWAIHWSEYFPNILNNCSAFSAKIVVHGLSFSVCFVAHSFLCQSRYYTVLHRSLCYLFYTSVCYLCNTHVYQDLDPCKLTLQTCFLCFFVSCATSGFSVTKYIRR